MARLSNGLPPEERRRYIVSQLVPGCVVRLTLKFPEKTKPKFLVLLAEEDPEYWTFILNTDINRFIEKRPHLLQCQVKIDTAGHPFLDHDSHVSCDKVWHLRREEVMLEIMNDTDCIKGCVTEAVRDQIVAAVKFAKTLTPAEKTRILASLEG